MADAPLGFTFTETMGGFVGDGATDYRKGSALGKRTAERFRFKLTILAEDLGSFLKDPEHAARMTGTVTSASLGEDIPVENAVFNLLQRDGDGRLWMKYRLDFTSRDGVPYSMAGFKDVHNDRMIDFWYDTTALFTDVEPAEGHAGAPAFRGILRIRPLDLVPQVISMRGMNTRNLAAHVVALARFGWFFFFTLVKEYARPPRRTREKRDG